MLKRIHVQHLTQGMYIHELCGSWMEHPFWRTQFLLASAQDLARIRDTPIQEVWIDTSRGLDVADGVATVSREQADAQIDSALAQAHATLPTAPHDNPTTMEQELHRAMAACSAAKRAVVSMFTEARMGRVIDAVQAEHVLDEISGSMRRNPSALLSLARLKNADEYTYMHSVAVAALMLALAQQLGLDEETERLAGRAGLLHDLGKAGIPAQILNKPGRLTDAEFDVMRNHPLLSHEMLLRGTTHEKVLDACLHHHEKMDGTGYPHNLKGEQISLLARMNAVCDVYDAITSNRPYKAGWDPSESLRRMAEWTQGHFDGRVFQAFVKRIGIYPVGSLVRLTSGRLAVVLEQSPGTLIAPRVKVFFSTRSDLRIPPEIVDLSARGCREKIAGREDPARWHFPDLNALWTGLAKTAW